MRYLFESITGSESLNKLSPMAEVLFYRLMVKADDFGRYSADPELVLPNCFPRKARVMEIKEIAGCLAELAVDEIDIYTVDGKEYLQFRNWTRFQRVRAKTSKYPGPEEGKKVQPAPKTNKPQTPAKPPEAANHVIPMVEKRTYGEFQNILLTDDEHKKLVEKFGEAGAKSWIEIVSCGKKSNKKYKYDSDYAAILNWERREQTGTKGDNPVKSASKIRVEK